MLASNVLGIAMGSYMFSRRTRHLMPISGGAELLQVVHRSDDVAKPP